MFNKTVIAIILGLILMVGCNPFAPAYDEEGLSDQNLLGDRTTLDGFFDYFKNSYEIRDTSLYGRILAPEFTFTYFDFDQAAEVSWDRGQELAISYNLFRNVQRITLDWNFYVERFESETEAIVNRNFNLTIVENENSAYTGTGRARLTLRRLAPNEPWKMVHWFDDSDF